MKERHWPAFILFFVSGACALIYETLWCKYLGLIFGNTVQSLSAVLAAFMGGLALGSLIGGRVSAKVKRPLMVYGVLELVIGIYCAVLPWILGDHGPLVNIYRTIYSDDGGALLSVARFAISFVLLLVPTTLMGATLPILGEFVVRSRESMGRLVGRLYAINTLGAVIGAAVGGFFLLPTFGKSSSNWITVCGNIALGLVAIALGRSQQLVEKTAEFETVTQPASRPRDPINARAIRAAMITFGVTGFAAMAMQIGWTRAISLSTGSSTYAFSLILSVFILGLSLGGFWGARAVSRTRDPVALLGRVLLFIGLSSVVVSILLGYGPFFFFFVLAWSSERTWEFLQIAEALLIGMIILVPTFLMGATTPLTVEIAAYSSEKTGQIVGRVYAFNTIGAILGSLVGGLLFLPFLHIQSTIELMSLMYAVPGLVLFVLSNSRRNRPALIATFGLALFMAVILIGSPRWDPITMSSGTYLLRDQKKVEAARQLRLLDALPQLSVRKALYYQEGAAASVAVIQAGDDMGLIVGGKPDASNYGDMTTQLTSMLIPAMLNTSERKEVLVIGLGSGVTAGAALAMDDVESVDVVEMSPEVVEASSYFRDFNGLHYTGGAHPWIDTPRLRLMVNDGRNYLLLGGKKYDVISSEPSNPWMTGVAGLYTREAFELAHSRLKPGGVACQWIQGYSLDKNNFNTVIRTFGEVYRYIQLCPVVLGDYLLIGSDSKIELSLSHLKALIEKKGNHDLLTRIQVASPTAFLSFFSADDRQMRELSKNSGIMTDDNMRLEFSAPKFMYDSHRMLPSHAFIAMPDSVIKFDPADEAERGKFLKELDLVIAAREHLSYTGDHIGDGAKHDSAIIMLAPQLRFAKVIENKHLEERVRGILDGRPGEMSEPNATAAIEMLKANPPQSRFIRWPERVLNQALLERAASSLEKGRGAEALADLQSVQHPDFAYKKLLLAARALGQLQQYDQAVLVSQQAASLPQAQYFECADLLARIQVAAGRTGDGHAIINAALGDPKANDARGAAPLYELRALLLMDRKDFGAALADIQTASRLDPENASYWRTQSKIQLELKDPMAAAESMRLYAGRLPLDLDASIDLAVALLRAANALGEDRVGSLNYLWRARRTCREICALHADSPRGWELLTRTFLELAKHDETGTNFYKTEAKTVYAHLLELLKGDVSKVPADLATDIGTMK